MLRGYKIGVQHSEQQDAKEPLKQSIIGLQLVFNWSVIQKFSFTIKKKDAAHLILSSYMVKLLSLCDEFIYKVP